MSKLRAALDEMRARHDLPPVTDEEHERTRRITHLRIAENLTLCNRAENTNTLGQWLDDDPAEVGCPICLAWMHA